MELVISSSKGGEPWSPKDGSDRCPACRACAYSPFRIPDTHLHSPTPWLRTSHFPLNPTLAISVTAVTITQVLTRIRWQKGCEGWVAHWDSRRSGPACPPPVSACLLDPSLSGFPGRNAFTDNRHPSDGSALPRTGLCSSQMLHDGCY